MGGMNRISCIECRQCNRSGKPSAMRLSKYCDDHYVGKVKSKGGILKFFTGIKDKIFDKRVDEKGQLKSTKGFRPSWFYR